MSDGSVGPVSALVYSVYSPNGTRTSTFTDNRISCAIQVKHDANNNIFVGTNQHSYGVSEFRPDGTFVRKHSDNAYDSVVVLPDNTLWAGGNHGAAGVVDVIDKTNGQIIRSFATTPEARRCGRGHEPLCAAPARAARGAAGELCGAREPRAARGTARQRHARLAGRLRAPPRRTVGRRVSERCDAMRCDAMRCDAMRDAMRCNLAAQCATEWEAWPNPGTNDWVESLWARPGNSKFRVYREKLGVSWARPGNSKFRVYRQKTGVSWAHPGNSNF